MNKARPGVSALFAWALAMGVLASGRCCCSDRTPSSWLVQATIFLVLFLTTARGSYTGAACLSGPSLMGRVPCSALCSPSTFVCQGKQAGDGLHLVSRPLLQHLLITDPLTECRDNRRIRNMWNSSTYLGEAGDEGPEGFPGLLPHGMKVGLHAMLLVRAGKVRRELRTELSPGLDRSRGEVHEPSPGWPGQGYMKVTCHDSIVSPSRRDGGDVDL
jgi:hypothetical protein